jgi:Tol biopolymer transport system component
MSTSVESAQIAVVDLETKRYRVIIPRGTYPKYSPTGHILYVAGGTLFAVGFDLNSLTVTTPTPVPVLEGVVMKESGAADFDISANGTLVYIGGGGDLSQRSVAWVDAAGKQQLLPAVEPGAYRSLSVGPGGRQIAFEDGPPGDGNLWIYDIAHATRNRLTSGDGDDRNPMWTPDGQRIVFASNRDGRLGVYAINADGTGSIDRLASVPEAFELWPQSWTKDGKTLVVSVAGVTQTAADILDITIDGGKVAPRIATPSIETQPAVSPNGELIAYMVLRENRPNINVERFPAMGDRRTVSSNSGLLPRWSMDGRQLFYF